jgi:cell division protein FtsB
MDELSTNKANLERFAREEYYMKRKNEEVFIIADED